jgi:sec-independent protein translocase protein TatA
MNDSITKILGMWTPGPLELIVIAVVALLILGRRLPEIARGLGKSLAEFKKGAKEAKDVKNDLENEMKDALTLEKSQAIESSQSVSLQL